MDVIVPVDGSKYSQWALDWVAQLPFASPINVKALHVVDLVSLRAPVTPHPILVWNEAIIQSETKRLVAEGKRIAAQTKERVSTLKLKAKVLVERGAVSPTILKHARGVEILVMHVMPFLRYPELKETGRSVVAHAARRLQKAGFRTEGVPRIGNPAEEIITYAEQREVDLIVSGARGLGAVARFFLGSTSTKILHHSHCSVLIVR